MGIGERPAFVDPVTGGAADPIVFPGPPGQWWLYYTQRRPDDPGPGVRWCHGTAIGRALSLDGGATWEYAGVVPGLDEPGETTTHWAPEVIRHEGRWHMFVTQVPGMPTTWDHPRAIVHYVSDDLAGWRRIGPLPLGSERAIDAGVSALPEGGWRLWYKNEEDDSATWCVDSDDLYSWRNPRPVLRGRPHEGPAVFALGGAWWLITDEWRGLAVHRSEDVDRWEPAGHLLAEPGSHPTDRGFGQHASVVGGSDAHGAEAAWLFYFCHAQEPGGGPHLPRTVAERRSVIHVARLETDGATLWCDRDGPVEIDLRRKEGA